MSPTNLRTAMIERMLDHAQDGVRRVAVPSVRNAVSELAGYLLDFQNGNESVMGSIRAVVPVVGTFPDGSLQAVRRVVGER